jgi:hypothetical protein
MVAALLAVVSPSKVHSGTGTGHAAPPKTRPVAVSMIDHIADIAYRRPPGPVPLPGRYLDLTEIVGSTSSLYVSNGQSGSGYTYFTSVFKKTWLERDGSGKQVTEPYQPIKFLAGHPTALTRERVSQSLRSTVFWRPHGAPPAYRLALRRLPTDPAKLQRYITRHFEDGHPDPRATFTFAAQLLAENPYPAVRAGLFRLVTDQPGIRVFGPATDPLGRHGIALGFDEDNVRQELVVDPNSTSVLAQVQIALPAFSRLPEGPGSIVGYRVFFPPKLVNSE